VRPQDGADWFKVLFGQLFVCRWQAARRQPAQRFRTCWFAILTRAPGVNRRSSGFVEPDNGLVLRGPSSPVVRGEKKPLRKSAPDDAYPPWVANKLGSEHKSATRMRIDSECSQHTIRRIHFWERVPCVCEAFARQSPCSASVRRCIRSAPRAMAKAARTAVCTRGSDNCRRAPCDPGKEITVEQLVQLYSSALSFNGTCVKGEVDPATRLMLGEITPIENAGQ